VEYLSKSKAIETLSDLSFPEFIHNKHFIPDITIRKRAKHVLSENHRVLDAVNALREDKLSLFGKLMNASHNSLRYDYEVTGTELDVMVEEARKIDGVLGARMTGAGFGGCSIALVEEDRVAFFKYQVGKNYKERTGLEAEFYISEIGDGTARINETNV
jgi:galactokinase